MPSPVTIEDLLKLFESPISRISQVMRGSSLQEKEGHLIKAWGGNNPVLVINFGVYSSTTLMVATLDDRLACRLLTKDDKIATDIVAFASYLDSKCCEAEPDVEEDAVIGTFALDIVVSPVPDWDTLRITDATVITREDSAAGTCLLGFCMQINLGVRLGVFVAPNPGITLSFNDSCDIILQQAREAEKRGLVTLTSRHYPGRKTPVAMEAIDWFDWLECRTRKRGSDKF